MAKVDTSPNTMFNWQDGQIMRAVDYKRERDTIILAVNNSDNEIQNVKSNYEYSLITQIMEVY